MAADNARLHPHIFDPKAASSQPFKTPRPGRGEKLSIQHPSCRHRAVPGRPRSAPHRAAAPRLRRSAPPAPARAQRLAREHPHQQRDRAQHAAYLLGKLGAVDPVAKQRAADQKAQGIDGGYGIYLQFESAPGFDLKFESLDFGPSGIELCSVRTLPNNLVQATVFVPDGSWPSS